MEFYLLLFMVAVWSSSAARRCNNEYELPCLTSKECIHKMQWCDRTTDCRDGSDERFCNVDSCPDSLFRCDNGKCIPTVANCDGFDNCGDGSDEICQMLIKKVDNVQKSALGAVKFYKVNLNASAAVKNAADYLLRERLVGNGWNSLTPRVAVALAFVQRAGLIPREWLPLLQKEVNIHIKINSMKRNGKPNLCDLAHSINALYATCQDPRNFEGADLVKLLRSEANAVKELDLPFVLLTLCIAQDVEDGDISALKKMQFNVSTGDRLGSTALIMMALKCISKTRRDHRTPLKKVTTDSILNEFDIYTKALNIQLWNAYNYKTNVDLKTHQRPDGSFGDMLATYYAIPAILNSSLLDLKCQNSISVDFSFLGRPMAAESSRGGSQLLESVYSLWIGKGDRIESHSTIISSDRHRTFYDVMKMAEAKNPFYRFLYEDTIIGKEVYSIADIPNDPEKGKFWTLYRGAKDRIRSYSKNYLTVQNKGVDKIFPAAGEHFVFWYDRK